MIFLKIISSTVDKPLEWDLTSSNTTVYHRINITQITTENNRTEWEYDEEQLTFEEFEKSPYGKKLAKLESLNGMCSGAIYQGINIGALHYNFGENAQINLSEISGLIAGGQTVFLYRADNENEQREYTVNEMKSIIKAKSEWKAVNTNYYEKLKQWVNRETNAEILKSIHYGSALPSDLLSELSTKLSGIGIDISKYSAMFS